MEGKLNKVKKRVNEVSITALIAVIVVITVIAIVNRHQLRISNYQPAAHLQFQFYHYLIKSIILGLFAFGTYLFYKYLNNTPIERIVTIFAIYSGSGSALKKLSYYFFQYNLNFNELSDLLKETIRKNLNSKTTNK
jgi:hypothetical protein